MQDRPAAAAEGVRTHLNVEEHATRRDGGAGAGQQARKEGQDLGRPPADSSERYCSKVQSQCHKQLRRRRRQHANDKLSLLQHTVRRTE